jgi:site-specific DNA-methyltransferase (adenine-specific)
LKKRAQNNRTLTLSAEETEPLRKKIVDAESVPGFSPADFVNRIINGDTMEILRFVPDEFADLIIIDPPYNLTKNFNGRKFHSCAEETYERYLEEWFPLVCKKLKKDGSLYMCGDWKCTSAIQRAMEKELTVINRITWQREKGRGAKSNWKNGMEDIWFGVKNPGDYFFDVESVKIKRKVLAPYRIGGKPKDWTEEADGNFRLTYPTNFWDDISVPFWSMAENTDHPTQKSEKLYAKLILASSEKGDMVFDPFLGSGPSCVTAKKLGRNFCGIEVNEEYCLWAQKRLENAEKDPSVQGYSGGVFWERNSFSSQARQKNQ